MLPLPEVLALLLGCLLAPAMLAARLLGGLGLASLPAAAMLWLAGTPRSRLALRLALLALSLRQRGMALGMAAALGAS